MECPWCYKEVTVRHGRCPACKMEIFDTQRLEESEVRLPEAGEYDTDAADLQEALETKDLEDFNSAFIEGGVPPQDSMPGCEAALKEESSLEEAITERFKCVKCGCRSCVVKEVAMTGTGLSKLMDIQHMHYLFVSCLECGFVEVYDPSVLRGHEAGRLGTILDTLFR
jgi:uncharacterized protein